MVSRTATTLLLLIYYAITTLNSCIYNEEDAAHYLVTSAGGESFVLESLGVPLRNTLTQTVHERQRGVNH